PPAAPAREGGVGPVSNAGRARPRTSAGMGGREGLGQVEVDDVQIYFARRRAAQDGVEVRAVVVQEATRVVHDLRNVQDMLFEDPEGVRIRQHEGECLRTGRGLARVQIDASVRSW